MCCVFIIKSMLMDKSQLELQCMKFSLVVPSFIGLLSKIKMLALPSFEDLNSVIMNIRNFSHTFDLQSFF